MDTQENQQKELRKLTWHSRRGMLELDVILLPFTETQYSALNDIDKLAYRRLIDCEDPDLFSWFMGNSKSDDSEINRMVQVVLNHARSR